MGGSAGGGSTNIDPRNPKQEQPVVGNWYDFQNKQFQNLIQSYPVLQQMNQGALDFFSQLPSTLSSLQNQFGDLPQQLQQQFGNLPRQLGQQFSQLPGQLLASSGRLQSQFARLPGQITEQMPTLQNANKYYGSILANNGALTPQGERDVAQQTRTLAGQYGTGRQLGTLGTELLNRDQAQQQRETWANQQYGQNAGLISGLAQAAQGLGTNLATTRAGLEQLAQGLGTNLAQVRQGLGTGLATTRQALGTGLAGAIQNLQSGGLNQLGSTATTSQNVFSGLQNPILSYLGNLFSNNLQARIAQAQINQQGNIASDNKTSGLIGGALSSLGSIAGAAAMSDERVKTKIKSTDLKTPEGVPMKTFEYKTKPGTRMLGVVAQDVEKRFPDRVLTDPKSGVKFVVGFPMIELSPPERKMA